MAQLASGELSEEEAASRLLGQSGSGETGTTEGPEASQSQEPSQAPSSSQSAAPSQSASQSGDNATQEAEAELRQLVATMYVLQATYEGKLEAIVQEAIDEYTAGEHTSENRTKIVYSKYDALTKLEKECDQKVANIVARMRELLKATGQSESLADEVQKTYEEEKSLKKAYYIRAFQEG